MSAQAIAQPTVPLRGRSGVIAVAAFAVVLLAASAGVAALVSDSSSGTAPSAVHSSAVVSADSCPGDGGALLTLVAPLAGSQRAELARLVSPSTTQMLHSAATMSASTGSSPPAANVATLAGVLSRISPNDSAVILNALEPQARADIQAATPQVCG